MKVQVLAAQEDTAAFHPLLEFLVTNGCDVRALLGEDLVRGTLNQEEMTMILWSLNSRLSPQYVELVDRAILADFAGNLVLGQLDDHPLPVGLLNTEPFDLRFTGMRKMRFGQMLGVLRKVDRARRHIVEPESLREKNDLFVCGADTDQSIILPLMDEMRKTGSVIWSGNTSDDNVMRQIETSQLFCLMCSADAYASDHVRRELLIASHFGKPVLPILLDGAVMPDDIEHFIGELQSVDMTEVNLENRSELILGAITA